MKITELDNSPAPELLNELWDKVRKADINGDYTNEELLRATIYRWMNDDPRNPVMNEDLIELASAEDDSFMGKYDSRADIAEWWFTEVDPVINAENVVIDWEATYSYSLGHDLVEYVVRCDLDGDGFAEFHHFFWRAY